MSKKTTTEMLAYIAVVIPTIVLVLSPYASSWNIPTHMISGAIVYRLLEATEQGKAGAGAIEAILKQHPRYANLRFQNLF